MTYEYYCTDCNQPFEKVLMIKERDDPLKDPCPSCKKVGTVKRGITVAAVSYSGFMSVQTRAGSGWNDVLKRLKKAGGRNSRIDHN